MALNYQLQLNFNCFWLWCDWDYDVIYHPQGHRIFIRLCIISSLINIECENSWHATNGKNDFSCTQFLLLWDMLSSPCICTYNFYILIKNAALKEGKISARHGWMQSLCVFFFVDNPITRNLWGIQLVIGKWARK